MKLDGSRISDPRSVSNRSAGFVHFQNPVRSFLCRSCVFTLLFFSQVLTGRDFESAKRAYDERDYATAIKEFTEVAEQGNAEAQLIVAKMYMIGQGVPQNADQAIKWYRASADQGNADAQFFLGAMYLLPQKDIAEGLKWLKLSAQQGMQDAQYLLGMAYLKGQNLTHDFVQAYMWLQLAAAQGGEFYQSQ